MWLVSNVLCIAVPCPFSMITMIIIIQIDVKQINNIMQLNTYETQIR